VRSCTPALPCLRLSGTPAATPVCLPSSAHEVAQPPVHHPSPGEWTPWSQNRNRLGPGCQKHNQSTSYTCLKRDVFAMRDCTRPSALRLWGSYLSYAPSPQSGIRARTITISLDGIADNNGLCYCIRYLGLSKSRKILTFAARYAAAFASISAFNLCGHAIGVLTGGCLVFGLSSQTPPALLTYLRTLSFPERSTT
jgi:hypothetical protein